VVAAVLALVLLLPAQEAQEAVALALLTLPQPLQELPIPVVVEAAGMLAPEVLAALALSSSRLTNKDIHAKQSLSILWN
jgi:hypothetical protein